MKALPEGVDIVTIYGPTACGKTAVACQLAEMLGGVVLSADSRQVYRGMDIGTGKDLAEYRLADGYEVPYRLIDVAEAGERYDLHRYLQDFDKAYDELPKEQPKILCGGTGLYISALYGGYRLSEVPPNKALRAELEQLSVEELMERLKTLGGAEMLESEELDGGEGVNPRRLVRAIELREAGATLPASDSSTRKPLRGPIFCLDPSRELRRARISARLEARLKSGLVEEVEGLLARVPKEVLLGYGLEYRYVTEYLLGERNWEEMHRGLEVAIHQFAKRQMTWARGLERRGFELIYLTPSEEPRETAEAMFASIFEKGENEI